MFQNILYRIQTHSKGGISLYLEVLQCTHLFLYNRITIIFRTALIKY